MMIMYRRSGNMGRANMYARQPAKTPAPAPVTRYHVVGQALPIVLLLGLLALGLMLAACDTVPAEGTVTSKGGYANGNGTYVYTLTICADDARTDCGEVRVDKVTADAYDLGDPFGEGIQGRVPAADNLPECRFDSANEVFVSPCLVIAEDDIPTDTFCEARRASGREYLIVSSCRPEWER